MSDAPLSTIDPTLESIYGDTDYRKYNIDDCDIDVSKISWMGTNANLADTAQEQLEMKLAARHQVSLGIIDEQGIPCGFTYDELNIPKEHQQRLAEQKKAIEKQKQQISQQQQQQQQQQIVPINAKTPHIIRQAAPWNKQESLLESIKKEKLRKANEIILKNSQPSPQRFGPFGN